jgi:hypothetical protein
VVSHANLIRRNFAGLLVQRAGELAQVIAPATALAGDAGSHSARWLSTSLHPMELDQVLALGARLRERNVHPLTAATAWLAATERAADRINFVVVGELASCVRILDREPAGRAHDPSRALEFVWSSVTEEVLAVRGRVEGWRGAPAAPRTSKAMPAVPAEPARG